MSTKPIRKALDVLTALFQTENDRKDIPNEVRDALAAVEAIEKAARVTTRCIDGEVKASHQSFIDAAELWDTITKESTT